MKNKCDVIDCKSQKEVLVVTNFIGKLMVTNYICWDHYDLLREIIMQSQKWWYKKQNE